MFRKFLLALFCLLLSHTVQADTPKDFSKISPTVKIVSYKAWYTPDVEPVSSGSGTIIDQSGLILTNHHVVFDEEAQQPFGAFGVCLTFALNQEPVCEYNARLVAHDEAIDLALLQLQPSDVYDRPVPTPLPFLATGSHGKLQEKQRIQVMGYPGSGGETITVSQGQISGFEDFNGFRYIKTDTDFDHGSSGGTVLNSEGKLIGVPTYIRSYAENVGYFLDLQEALPWIELHHDSEAITQEKAEQILRQRLQQIAEAKATRVYRHEVYPAFTLDLPEGWELLAAYKDSAIFWQKKAKNPVGLSMDISFYQFPINQTYYDWLYGDLDRLKEQYTDYERKKITLAGQQADRIRYTDPVQQHTEYYLPYGYAMVHLSYHLDLNKREEQQRAIDLLLQSLTFPEAAMAEPDLPQIMTLEDPAFRISSEGDWRFQRHPGIRPEGLLLEAVEKDNFEGYIYVFYQRIPKGDQDLPAESQLKKAIQEREFGNFKIINTRSDVLLDGLKGWLLSYEYEGEKYQEIRQHLEVHLSHTAQYELVFRYDDLNASFEDNRPVIEAILNSFKNDDPDKGQTEKDIYRFGTLGNAFDDIHFHRFASAITSLADKGLLLEKEGHFYPEQRITRAEALRLIIESKNHLERERGGKMIDLKLTIRDQRQCQKMYTDLLTAQPFVAPLCYAARTGLMGGYGKGKLRPTQEINLAEALKLMIGIYQLQVWKDPHGTVPWYKPYMDKAFELDLIPGGLEGPNHRLTRAELAYLIDTIYRQAK